MKDKLTISVFLCGLLLTPLAGQAADAERMGDSDLERSRPVTFVKDSVITAKIKSSLAAERLSSLTKIKVDTDKDGAVWLSGTAKTQADVSRAEEIARNTEGVKSVHNTIKVQTSR